MTLRELGENVGFSKATADVRIAQYESGQRTPKAQLMTALAEVLEVSPAALVDQESENNETLMHCLFALEDLRGLRVSWNNGQIQLYFDSPKNKNDKELLDDLRSWSIQRAHLEHGDITQEEYDRWRYNFS